MPMDASRSNFERRSTAPHSTRDSRRRPQQRRAENQSGKKKTERSSSYHPDVSLERSVKTGKSYL
jgi:hypothetical protein